MARFNTQLVHGLPVNDNNTGAVNPPIYNSTTYAFESVNAMPRYDYARSGNPTRDFLERQIAQLEHGTRGFAFASGLAAIHAVLAIFQPGDRIIVGDNIYGGSYSQFNEFFTRWGLKIESVDAQDLTALEAAIKGDQNNGIAPAKAVYFETLTNPLLKVNDAHAIAEIAHAYGALAIVDNTFVTPYLQQPLDLGVDVVIHSATKYLAGHSEVNAGLVVVRRDDLANRIYFNQNRLGGVLAPAECDAVRRGIQTLALRMERQQENTLAIAQYLLAHPLVRTVHYPGLPSASEDLAAKGLKGGGGVLSFEVVPGVDPADVLDNLHLFHLAVSLGAVESLAELPCRMTHFELPREERLKIGISDELIRLSVGIEDAADLIEDLGQAFEVAYEALERSNRVASDGITNVADDVLTVANDSCVR
ncbi:trans-sulfuration enzyme family protein [Bifidobacterium oedipodis]|uniref:cysteine-S-conjugate beta-lyase n=1 Tax=Bifidobacterium oedipodis TaxID=2675322 RepID=A0A7Y0EMA1_9BIFI|nr:aminotransferase class I/II-fold pyridoxal phosphate-dependent enzyme [Bifidobacterium sp. DSM 109957]NMM92874.1 cystathionine beta-lyase [Bifidobacterium sp. DSM 109957]